MADVLEVDKGDMGARGAMAVEGDIGDTRIYFRNSFPVMGSASMLERYGTMKDTNTTKAHHSLVKKPQR
jgi:hypothetical protein